MANITMSVDQITEIVSKLQSSSNEIESIWNSINSTEVQKIKESWIGKDCDAYISKLQEVDADVQKALILGSIESGLNKYSFANSSIFIPLAILIIPSNICVPSV
mgnify:CR=1 FL=1